MSCMGGGNEYAREVKGINLRTKFLLQNTKIYDQCLDQNDDSMKKPVSILFFFLQVKLKRSLKRGTNLSFTIPHAGY
jgi:hypothetical protein